MHAALVVAPAAGCRQTSLEMSQVAWGTSAGQAVPLVSLVNVTMRIPARQCVLTLIVFHMLTVSPPQQV
jgi:hypothetical protein